MRAGQLDRRITVLRPIVAQSDSGEETRSFAALATVAARKIENRGQERFAAQQYVGHAVRTFWIRWSSTVAVINDEYKILFDGRAFDITDVREIGRREGIEIDGYARAESALKVTGPSYYYLGF